MYRVAGTLLGALTFGGKRPPHRDLRRDVRDAGGVELGGEAAQQPAGLLEVVAERAPQPQVIVNVVLERAHRSAPGHGSAT